MSLKSSDVVALIACPHCGAAIGEACVIDDERAIAVGVRLRATYTIHRARVVAYANGEPERPIYPMPEPPRPQPEPEPGGDA